jgi:hypothetical protein
MGGMWDERLPLVPRPCHALMSWVRKWSWVTCVSRGAVTSAYGSLCSKSYAMPGLAPWISCPFARQQPSRESIYSPL